MLELILQQRYRVDGIPVDISPYRNHGTGLDTVGTAGPAQDHDAVRFPHPGSRVRIGLGDQGAWSPLVAMRIEVVVRVDPSAARTLALVEGDGSFRFAIFETALEASFAGPPGDGTYVRSDSTFAPDGQMHVVPADRWVTLGFQHDGFATMRLTIDGRVVGETSAAGAIPPVQGGGVSVGNGVGGGRPLLGDIDEVRIWREYPRAVEQEFLCRPYERATARCWEDIVRAVRAWAARDPDGAQALADLLADQQRDLLRALFLLPADEQERVRGILRDYVRLWCEGSIDGPAMRHVLRQWVAALRRHGHDPATDPRRAEFDALRLQAGVHLDLDCDPAVAAFSRMLQDAVGGR